jgi:hypothetical protein
MSKHIPDYSAYHLHELEAALSIIDELANPDEARTIKSYIEKGGYKYPTGVMEFTQATLSKPTVESTQKASRTKVAKCVSFSNDRYRKILSGVIWCLFSINLLTLVLAQEPLALLPLAFQGSILAAIYLRHRYARLLIKTWCGLLIFSAAARLLGMVLLSSFSSGGVIWNLIVLTTGVAFLVPVSRYVHLVFEQEDTSAE